MTDLCNWTQEDDDWGTYGPYETDCGRSFNIIDGTPADNEFKYCCYCGKKLIGHPFVWSDNEDT